MHATIRRIRTNPGQAGEVARLIEQEYLPMIEQQAGFVSYTLVDLGGDEVSSFGVFASAEQAEWANQAARAWTTERLTPLVASALQTSAGVVMVDHRAG